MIIKKQVIFNAASEKVWDLLTNPEMTKQYMFGCEVSSDWVKGSPVLWKSVGEDGKIIVVVKGEVIQVDLGRMVSLTMFDPTIGIEDIPENYATLTYEVSASSSETTLILTQSFEGVEKAEKRYEESVRGWDMVIQKMVDLIS